MFCAYKLFDNSVKLETSQELLAEPIFYNDKFKIDKQHFCFKSWTKGNVFFVRDLVDTQGQFFTWRAFLNKYKVKSNYLEYMSCIRSIKMYIRNKYIETNNDQSNEQTKSIWTLITKK